MEHLLWINVNPTWMSICMQDYAHLLQFCKICWVMPTCSTVSSRKRPLERNVPKGMPCLKQDFRLQVTSSLSFDIGQYSENHVWSRRGDIVWKWLSTVHSSRIVSFVQLQILKCIVFQCREILEFLFKKKALGSCRMDHLRFKCPQNYKKIIEN